jgi:hypothetical protein
MRKKKMAFYEKLPNLKKSARPDCAFGDAWYCVGNNAIHIIQSEDRGRANLQQEMARRDRRCVREVSHDQ